jgi:pyruvate ferredoxin oxidoreductase gamma subunit
VSFEVRIHGRGGQGVVTAAELLSVAGFAEGRHAQAFPSFGSERTGAPVVAFCRFSDHTIRTREPVSTPGALIIQDATLLHQVDVFGGLGHDGYVLINSARGLRELGLEDLLARHREERMLTVDATEIARAHIGRPVPNAALLGGFAALTGEVSIDSVAAAIRDRFSGALASGNEAAARAAFRAVHQARREPAHA